MRKLTYKIVEDTGSKITQREVNGYHAFDMYGLAFGVEKDNHWDVTELSTGMKVTRGLHNTRKKAVKQALDTLRNVGEGTTIECVTKQHKRLVDLGVLN